MTRGPITYRKAVLHRVISANTYLAENGPQTFTPPWDDDNPSHEEYEMDERTWSQFHRPDTITITIEVGNTVAWDTP
jgi:hypothetical protein